MKKIYAFLITASALLTLASCSHTHTPVISPAVAPTCTQPGLTEGTHCSGCGEAIFAQSLVPKRGHTVIIDEAVEATCLNEGLTEGSHCFVCKAVLVEQEVIPKTGHNITMLKALEPTCSSEGHTAGEGCSVCGMMVDESEMIAKLPHTEVTVPAVSPTCTAEGRTAGKMCSVCGEVTDEGEAVATVPHTEVARPEIAPTCTAEGRTEGKECSVCGEITDEGEIIAKLPHTEVTVPAVSPTCTAEGRTESKECSVCGEILASYEVVARLAHTETEFDAIEPTCTEEGRTKGISCSVCGEIISGGTTVEALGHSEVIDKAVDATYTETGLTEGSHCDRCGEVLIAQATVPVLEKANVNYPLGYITKAPTTIKTKHLELKIDPNVYVPGNLVEVLDTITSVMETVSGMKFEGNPNYRSKFGIWNANSISELTLVEVEKSDIDAEYNSAYASSTGAVISSGDIINLSTLIHECSHVLQSRQSKWHYCTWAMEAISNYTVYKTQLYIIENYPNLAEFVDSPVQSIRDMSVNDYSEIYKHSMEYWIDNVFEGSGNKNYAIGFRLAWFLDETYGDYTKWIFALEESYPFADNSTNTDQLSKEKILEAFYLAYGESVFDDFYAWLKNNEERTNTEMFTVDLREADTIAVYPKVFWLGTEYKPSLTKFYAEYGILYRDLYISLEPGNQYLTEYKGRTYEKLTLLVNEGVTVKLFDENGYYIRTDSGDSIDLTGVSVVKLEGEGKLIRFEITGFTDPK